MLLAVLASAARAQSPGPPIATSAGESHLIVRDFLQNPDTAELRALVHALGRLPYEPVVLDEAMACPYGLYLIANEPSASQGAFARNRFAEMIPILEEGLRIARELAALQAGRPQSEMKP